MSCTSFPVADRRKAFAIRSATASMPNGLVAKFRCAGVATSGIAVWQTGLSSDAEESGNEESLAEHISFAQPSHSPLPNHVDCFDALQGPPRALKRAVAFGQPHTFFHTTMVLLHHII